MNSHLLIANLFVKRLIERLIRPSASGVCILLTALVGCVPTASLEPVPADVKMEIQASPPDLPTSVLSETDTPSESTTLTDPLPLVIAVCPSPFRESLEPWVQRRTREGLEVTVIHSEPTAVELKRSLGENNVDRCKYILLVGDSQLAANGEPSDPERYVPTLYRNADATAAYQQDIRLPGDYEYGDFDDSGTIKAAVGRLPVRTASQLDSIIKRIIAYEDSTDFGLWRSRVDLVAGIGGFGPMVDGAIEMVASSIITGSLPGFVRTRITHASPTSDFHPGVDQFTSTVLGNYQDGARFWVYAGHGWVNELDRVPPTRAGRPVLSLDDLPQLNRPHSSPPIALLLACYTGAFDAHEDCLAERMLLADGGPIAVLAGTRVTMPYGNASAAMGLIHAVYHQKAERLGDAWQHALTEMATPASQDPNLQARRMMVDSIASLMGGGSTIDKERHEHMQLYNWLGDPTLRLCNEQSLLIDELPDATIHEPLIISGTTPFSGTLVVEVHRRLGTPAIGTDKSSPSYLAANDTILGRLEQPVTAGPWQCQLFLSDTVKLNLPPSTPVIIKATVEGETQCAAGSRTTWLRSPTATTSSK